MTACVSVLYHIKKNLKVIISMLNFTRKIMHRLAPSSGPPTQVLCMCHGVVESKEDGLMDVHREGAKWAETFLMPQTAI